MCLVAEMMAIGIAIAHTTIRLAKERAIVIGRRVLSTSATVISQMNERPKVPLNTVRIHLRYWMYMGWSRPYCCLRFSISASSNFRPMASNCVI